ncbi:MAG: hypothetical protein AAFO04_25430 [Cyanobacteria bacterium J06592_8]
MNFEYLLSLINGGHTHEKFENELEIDKQLAIKSVHDAGRSWLRRDANNTFILADRDGDGSWENPYPLRLNHLNNQAFVFDNEIYHRGNLPIEEGTFSPLIVDMNSLTSFDISYQTNAGYYSRIGNSCTVHIIIRIGSVNDETTAMNSIAIGSLPYPLEGGRWPAVPINIARFSPPDDYLLNAAVLRADSFISLNYINTETSLTSFKLNNIKSGTEIRVSTTYAV